MPNTFAMTQEDTQELIGKSIQEHGEWFAETNTPLVRACKTWGIGKPTRPMPRGTLQEMIQIAEQKLVLQFDLVNTQQSALLNARNMYRQLEAMTQSYFDENAHSYPQCKTHF